MNDDRLHDDRLAGDLRASLLRDDPGPLPESLRRSVEAVPDEAGRRLVRAARAPRLVAALEAIAALIAIAAIVGTALYLRGSSAGPGATGLTPSGQPVTSPSYFPSGSAPASPGGTPAASPPVAMWSGLAWSVAGSIQGSAGVADVVEWNGKLIAAADIDTGSGNLETGFWSSSDGISWTALTVNRAAFAGGGRVARMAVAPLGLIAWGWIGQPVCTGQGEGMTCDPPPIMIWTSPDGTTWTRIADVSMFKNATIQDIAVGAHGLVAAGDTGWTQPALWTSSNGASWKRQDLGSPTFAGAHFADVRTTVSGYLIGGATGGKAPVAGGMQPPSTSVAAAWWSADGQNWTKATVHRSGNLGTTFGTIHVGAHGMVAIGSAEGGKGSTAWTSIDGRTWQPAGAAPFAVPPGVSDTTTVPSNQISDDGTRMVAVSIDNSGLLLWESADGVVWQPLTQSGASVLDANSWGATYVLSDGLEVLSQQHTPTDLVSTWRLTVSP